MLAEVDCNDPTSGSGVKIVGSATEKFVLVAAAWVEEL